MNARIIVGFTDSDAGRRAVDWAAARALARHTPLHVLTVIGGAAGAVGEGRLIDALLTESTAQLEQLASALSAQGVTVTTEVVRGNPVHVLLEASKNASLLVIGSDHQAGTRERRGMHGVRIAAGSSCPVAVIPELDDRERSGVYVGVDGSPVSSAAVAFAAAEADRLGEPLIAVGVWTPLEVAASPVLITSEYLDSMQSLTEEAVAVELAGLRQDYPDIDIRTQVSSGYPSTVLLDAGENAALLVVGSHGRGAVARFLLGSISHEVLAGLTAPTVVAR